MLWLMPLKRYCQFYGRSGRAEFWQFTIFYVAAVFVAFILDYSMQGPNGQPMLTSIAYLALALPSYAVLLRRIHDRNLSGWLLATVPLLDGIYFTADSLRSAVLGTPVELAFNPIVDGVLALTLMLVIYIIVQAALPSDPKPNRFGDGPTGSTGPAPGAADLHVRAKTLLHHLANPTEPSSAPATGSAMVGSLDGPFASSSLAAAQASTVDAHHVKDGKGS